MYAKKERNTPYQVQQLINDMLQSKENVYVRGNYRMRLDELRDTISEAIKRYDLEKNSYETKRKKQR